MKQRIHYIVYAVEQPKPFTGILGSLQMYPVHFLFAGGKYCIEETFEGTDPIGWYVDVLKEQDMVIKATKQQKYKGQTYIWIEIDATKTNIAEYASVKDIDPTDDETLAWRTYWVTVSPETKQECLGLAVVARETLLQKSKPAITLQQVLDAILAA